MLRELFRCRGCEAREAEIGFLRAHNGQLLDQILTLGGRPDATREAVPLVPSSIDPAGGKTEEEIIEEEEAAQVRLDDVAALELARYADKHGVPPEVFRDA